MLLFSMNGESEALRSFSSKDPAPPHPKAINGIHLGPEVLMRFMFNNDYSWWGFSRKT
jgi:hypothetical protein